MHCVMCHTAVLLYEKEPLLGNLDPFIKVNFKYLKN